MVVLNVIFMIVSVLIIIITLLQSGKDGGLGGVIGGQSIANTFAEKKERGPEVVISRITFVLGVLFFTLAIVMHFLMMK
ncbi:MAG: preprotein translocase subunit SecG [Bacilli bacterium]|nr:preprotein translocase subunit SecG [Bacilli bacterium]